jgi:hypothetical protein
MDNKFTAKKGGCIKRQKQVQRHIDPSVGGAMSPFSMLDMGMSLPIKIGRDMAVTLETASFTYP